MSAQKTMRRGSYIEQKIEGGKGYWAIVHERRTGRLDTKGNGTGQEKKKLALKGQHRDPGENQTGKEPKEGPSEGVPGVRQSWREENPKKIHETETARWGREERDMSSDKQNKRGGVPRA